jgi:hypothetical protein
MFSFGPPNITKLEDKKDLKGLIKALDYKKDEYVRSQAVFYTLSFF